MKTIFFLLLTAFSLTAIAADKAADKAAAEKAKQEAKAAAEKQKALRKQAQEECAKVSAEMDALMKEIGKDLKANAVEEAVKKADRLLELAAFVGCDGKTVPRFTTETVLARTLIPGFSGRKLSAAEHTLKFYDMYFAFMEKSGRPVPFHIQMQRIGFLDDFGFADSAALRKQADEAVEAYCKSPACLQSRNPDQEYFRALFTRACMFGSADFAAYADRADKAAGGDHEKRIAFYRAFLGINRPNTWYQTDTVRRLCELARKDPVLSDADRAIMLGGVLGLTFDQKEALFEKALKTKGLSEADSRQIHTLIVRMERDGLTRGWLAETPMRYNGTGLVSSPDPACYAKAKASLKHLIATFKPDEAKKEQSLKNLQKLYLDMLSLNFDGQQYADVRTTAAELEKALPELQNQWRKYTVGYLAASAYFEENFEEAYKLFSSIPADEYRKDTGLWRRIVEPYLRTCCAMEKYDEAYLLTPDIHKYVIEYWEYWHQTRYRRMFAELAKKCRPETLEAVKNAGAKKK